MPLEKWEWSSWSYKQGFETVLEQYPLEFQLFPYQSRVGFIQERSLSFTPIIMIIPGHNKNIDISCIDNHFETSTRSIILVIIFSNIPQCKVFSHMLCQFQISGPICCAVCWNLAQHAPWRSLISTRQEYYWNHQVKYDTQYNLTMYISACSIIFWRILHTLNNVINLGSHTSQMRKFKGISRVIMGSTSHFQRYFWKTVVTLLYINKISSNFSHLFTFFLSKQYSNQGWQG